jgi:glycosyltransferase involved in cell wall biosynthesis
MVNKYLYPRAGAETYMISVAEELIRRGHTVGFFGMDHPENTNLGPSATIPFLEFGAHRSLPARLHALAKAGGLALTQATQRRFDAFVADFNPDLIHGHNLYNQLSPALFRRAMGQRPCLMTVHDYKPVCPNYSLFVGGTNCTRCVGGSVLSCIRYRCCQGSLPISLLAALSAGRHRLRRTYQRDFSGLIAPSAFMKKQLVAGGLDGERITVLNNFAAPLDTPSPPGTGLLYAGRLCREKGIDTLIRAYAALPDGQRPPLTIAGEGPLGDELKTLAAAHNLSEIRWLGRIPPEAVRRELQACAVSVVPSRWYENCSMAIMESLAAGRPCLVSDSGGNPELVRHEQDGWVFAAGDEAHLCRQLEAIAALGQGERKQMGEAAVDACQRRFSPAVHLEGLLALYQQALNGSFTTGDRDD